MSKISIYQLKPAFQGMLRPLVHRLAQWGVTANAVTGLAMAISLIVGALMYWQGLAHPILFLLIPLWMFVRMALNAIDGMLAREFNQKSPLGAYLNELSDVVSDGALYLPFALVHPMNIFVVGLIIFMSALSEMTGALGPMIGAGRQYAGPMGKSDRAFVFGVLGLWAALSGAWLPNWTFWIMAVAVPLAIAMNIINRIRGGLAQHPTQQSS